MEIADAFPALRLTYNGASPNRYWEVYLDVADSLNNLHFRYLDSSSVVQAGPYFIGSAVRATRFYGYAGGDGAELQRRTGGGSTISFDSDGTVGSGKIYYGSTLVKTFIIDHPINKSKFLVHGTLEGPEAGVYYRGSAKLNNGKVAIKLPTYFEALTCKTERTIILTHIDGFDKLMVKKINGQKIKNGEFIVASDNPASSQEFDWEVKAVRNDVEPLVVEPSKSEVEVCGQGPYTFAKKRELINA